MTTAPTQNASSPALEVTEQSSAAIRLGKVLNHLRYLAEVAWITDYLADPEGFARLWSVVKILARELFGMDERHPRIQSQIDHIQQEWYWIFRGECHQEQLAQENARLIAAQERGIDLPRPDTPRERRERLWTAPRRNAALAAVAEALVAGDPSALWDYGLFLQDDDPFRRWDREPRVTVLVESARHADALARLLPDWAIMDRRPSHGDPASTGDGWSRWTVPHRSIMTAVRAAEYRAFDVDVIVSAAGGFAPQLPVGLARRGGHVLVVDFDDSGDRSQSSDTESRRQSYDRLLQSEMLS